jgi:hypothetical protein
LAVPGPLTGIKVVELGVWVAAPAAGGILADWGADVIKIEPPTGDPARMFGRMMQIESGENPPFEMDNRSKRSIVLDAGGDRAAGFCALPGGRACRLARRCALGLRARRGAHPTDAMSALAFGDRTGTCE